jgi:fructose/tagatose bisphosphate aldolase
MTKPDFAFSDVLDLSKEPNDENIAICSQYFKKMASMKIWLKMETGITRGEEDGVDNKHIDPEKLYNSPEQVFAVYKELSNSIFQPAGNSSRNGSIHPMFDKSWSTMDSLLFCLIIVLQLCLVWIDDTHFVITGHC